jgi:predicted lipid-binding transport protein (Tim44 family)
MPFFRSLTETAPDANPDIPWPIHGLAYVITIMGGMSGGAAVGLIAGGFIGLAIGVIVGVVIALGFAWVNDRFIDAWIAKFQVYLQRGVPRLLVNIAAFSCAIGICAISVSLR